MSAYLAQIEAAQAGVCSHGGHGYDAETCSEITAGPVPVICPRCGREAVGWPLLRGDRCAPKDWAACIRNPEMILAKETQR